MATTISTVKSKNIIEALIQNDFDKIDFSTEYIYNRADELIETARSYGLLDLAEKMETDKNTELWC